MIRGKIKRLFTGLMCAALLVTGVTTNTVSTKAASVPDIVYSGHVQNIGWQKYVKNGDVSGTTGKALRLEAIKINLKNGSKSMIQYRSHVENLGWQSWTNSGGISGTTGKGYRMEAIQIRLTNEYANMYDVYYRVHVPTFGWLGYAKNGQTAGSTGAALRVEAIQIRLVKKGQNIPTNKQAELIKPTLKYQAHSQNVGWMNKVTDNAVAGTVGKSYRLEALTVALQGGNIQGGLSYRAHVSNVGWQSYKSAGQVMGTTGQGKAIEAVQIRLTGDMTKCFDIYYRMHVANLGWLGWAKNGELAGTTGSGIKAEAIQIRLLPKNASFNRGGAAYYNKPGKSASSTASSFQMPLTNARCSWRSSTNWSWGNGTTGRTYHLGVDIIGSSDSVMATANGTVASCGYNKANGNYVVLKHNILGQTVYSFYAHLASYSVKMGSTVAKGSRIGTVGNTGESSKGKHLHFAMMDKLWNGSYYGYATRFTGNKVQYGGATYYNPVTYYNPIYVVQNHRLP